MRIRSLLAGAFALAAVTAPAGASSPVEIVYVDEELAPTASFDDDLFAGEPTRPGAAIDLLRDMHPLYTQLRRGLIRYRERWGDLPSVELPEGPTLRPGARGERVAELRYRLGLVDGERYDEAVEDEVRAWQRTHGLTESGITDRATIASLNLGADHYERIIRINLERARSLPGDRSGRYVVVDSAAARLWMFEGRQAIDSMKVAVGTDVQPTPMMAGLLRQVEFNPYWNVPPDMARTLIAPRVLAQGMIYLSDRGYQVLSDWSDEAVPVDPETVDWQAVADGDVELRVRQLPGPANSMGDMKFLMPNELGIYLHDTPNASVFAAEQRFVSNGCIRVEDAERLASWLFGSIPEPGDDDRPTFVDLETPVPLYISYFTAAPSAEGGIQFRPDTYGRDGPLMARMFPDVPTETAAR